MGDHARAEARGRAFGDAPTKDPLHVITAAQVQVFPG